jgi:hypothetical protein
LCDEGIPSRLGIGLKLQPRQAGDLHLGPQTDGSAWLNGLDPPKINRVPHPQIDGISAAAAESHTSDQAIEDPA